MLFAAAAGHLDGDGGRHIWHEMSDHRADEEDEMLKHQKERQPGGQNAVIVQRGRARVVTKPLHKRERKNRGVCVRALACCCSQQLGGGVRDLVVAVDLSWIAGEDGAVGVE